MPAFLPPAALQAEMNRTQRLEQEARQAQQVRGSGRAHR